MKLAEVTNGEVAGSNSVTDIAAETERPYTVAVFCGSQQGTDPLYLRHAEELGLLLAQNHIHMVYGGGNTGLMGAVTNSCLKAGGQVTGVIPQILAGRERAHKGLSQIHIVENMHIRKGMMYQLSDAIIILPGGNGTLDEMFESITWNNLGIHDKKIMLLNTNHFYDALIRHYEKMSTAGFLYRKAPLNVCLEPAELISLLVTKD